MSVSDAYWTPPDGGLGREVPVCAMDAHKLERGIEPEMRKVEVNGTPVNYVNAGFAPSYWGGFGFGPGLFTGFLIGEALAPGGLSGAPATTRRQRLRRGLRRLRRRRLRGDASAAGTSAAGTSRRYSAGTLTDARPTRGRSPC
jgi:hypothetical protein